MTLCHNSRTITVLAAAAAVKRMCSWYDAVEKHSYRSNAYHQISRNFPPNITEMTSYRRNTSRDPYDPECPQQLTQTFSDRHKCLISNVTFVVWYNGSISYLASRSFIRRLHSSNTHPTPRTISPANNPCCRFFRYTGASKFV